MAVAAILFAIFLAEVEASYSSRSACEAACMDICERNGSAFFCPFSVSNAYCVGFFALRNGNMDLTEICRGQAWSIGTSGYEHPEQSGKSGSGMIDHFLTDSNKFPILIAHVTGASVREGAVIIFPRWEFRLSPETDFNSFAPPRTCYQRRRSSCSYRKSQQKNIVRTIFQNAALAGVLVVGVVISAALALTLAICGRNQSCPLYNSIRRSRSVSLNAEASEAVLFSELQRCPAQRTVVYPSGLAQPSTRLSTQPVIGFSPPRPYQYHPSPSFPNFSYDYESSAQPAYYQYDY